MITAQRIRERNLANLEQHINELEKLRQLSDKPEFRQKINSLLRRAHARKAELQGKVVSQ